MKIRFPGQEDQHPTGATASKRGLRILAGVLLAVLLAGAVFVLLQPQKSLQSIANLERRWGADAHGPERGLAENWSIAIGSFFRSQIADLPDVPELVIDVPFRDMRKIYQKREEALAIGHLVQADDDFVNGSIRVDGRTVPVKLRLKGDWVDHLQGRKWSFRIRVRGGDHVLGMRRFSLQHPLTRGYQGEILYFELLRGLGVMAPRYQFVDVTLNGDAVGLMALEEFFAKELLEHNRRREGVIVRFDESLPWSARDSLSGDPVGWNGSFDDYRNAAIDGIGSTKIAESAVLSEQYRVAQGLLRGFADGKLTASQVFDVQQLGRFIAASDVLGAWHATRWANLRFYLNPITLKLEPIAFDADLQSAFRDGRSIVNSEPVLLDMLQDPEIWRVYVETLELLNHLVADGTLQANLAGVEGDWLPLLQTEFRMLGDYSLDHLQARAASLYESMSRVAAEDTDTLAYFLPFEPQLYPVLVHLSMLDVDAGLAVQVENAIPKDVTLDSVEWVNEQTGERRDAVGDAVPLGVPPRGIGSPGQRLQLPLAGPPAADGWFLEAGARIAGRSWSTTMRPTRSQGGLAAPPRPQAGIGPQLLRHEFLRRDGNEMHVASGDWLVSQHLIVPDDFSLHMPAGATLRFAPDAALIAYGDLQFKGSDDEPVMLLAAAESWPGIVVMNAGTASVLENVVIGSTHSVELPGWTLTGGVNFYRSDVSISKTRFMNSRGEDALNIIESMFTIHDSVFRNTASDAFDADFAEGAVDNTHFEQIGSAGGGDAIDISGSNVNLTNVRFERVSDKAISVGERSEMTARYVEVSGAGTGAAAKDASLLVIRDSRIDGAGFAALTAYVKKPEYGPPRLVADSVVFSDTETSAIAQTGSELLIDGEAVPVQDIDVDALYETIMRPGAAAVSAAGGDKLRHEVKFVTYGTEYTALRHWLNVHPAGFRATFAPRRINNVYFDDWEHRAWAENLAGVSRRRKLRYRWYGESDGPAPGQLEVKHRRDRLGWKQRFPVDMRVWTPGWSWDDVRMAIYEQLPPAGRFWLDQNPQTVIINRYERDYFVSADGRVRATLDTAQAVYDQRLRQQPNLRRAAPMRDTVVAEFKFAPQDRDHATDILAHVPVRLGRHSKYMNGVRAIAML